MRSIIEEKSQDLGRIGWWLCKHKCKTSERFSGGLSFNGVGLLGIENKLIHFGLKDRKHNGRFNGSGHLLTICYYLIGMVKIRKDSLGQVRLIN